MPLSASAARRSVFALTLLATSLSAVAAEKPKPAATDAKQPSYYGPPARH